jgi:hypothetical protein
MGGNVWSAGIICPAFDRFFDLNCEDLQARLDNFSVTLGELSEAQATIMVYEGRYRGGRNPRRGEALARAARIKDYLVNYRGVKPERVVIRDGGYRNEFTVELYLCPRGVVPAADPSLQRKDIKFSKGRIRAREFKWSCL